MGHFTLMGDHISLNQDMQVPALTVLLCWVKRTSFAATVGPVDAVIQHGYFSVLLSAFTLSWTQRQVFEMLYVKMWFIWKDIEGRPMQLVPI